MKRRFRRVLSAALAAVMVVTAVPTGVIADEAVPAEMATEDPAARQAEEDQKAAEAQKAAEEEAARKAAEEEEARKAAEAQKAAEEEEARKAAEAQKAAEEEEARKAAEAQKAAEEEEARKAAEAQKAADEEAARKAEEAQKAADEEAARKAEEAQKAADEEAARKAEEAQKAADEEAARKAEEAARQAEQGSNPGEQNPPAAPGQGNAEQQTEQTKNEQGNTAPESEEKKTEQTNTEPHSEGTETGQDTAVQQAEGTNTVPDAGTKEQTTSETEPASDSQPADGTQAAPGSPAPDAAAEGQPLTTVPQASANQMSALTIPGDTFDEKPEVLAAGEKEITQITWTWKFGDEELGSTASKQTMFDGSDQASKVTAVATGKYDNGGTLEEVPLGVVRPDVPARNASTTAYTLTFRATATGDVTIPTTVEDTANFALTIIPAEVDVTVQWEADGEDPLSAASQEFTGKTYVPKATFREIGAQDDTNCTACLLGDIGGARNVKWNNEAVAAYTVSVDAEQFSAAYQNYKPKSQLSGFPSLTITQKQITVVWDWKGNPYVVSSEVEFDAETYPSPTVGPEELPDEAVSLQVTGKYTPLGGTEGPLSTIYNVGTYSFTASLTASEGSEALVKNYTLSEASKSFKINPREVSVEISWKADEDQAPLSAASQEFTGKTYVPKATFREIGAQDDTNCTACLLGDIGGARNVKWNNEAVAAYTVSVDAEQFSAAYQNYKPKSQLSGFPSLTIIPKQITVSWDFGNNPYFGYEGVEFDAETYPSPTVGPEELPDEAVSLQVTGKYTPLGGTEGPLSTIRNVGTYSFTASLTASEGYEALVKNYTLSDASKQFTIAQKAVEVQIAWNADGEVPQKEEKNEHIYDGKYHTPSASFTLVEGDTDYEGSTAEVELTDTSKPAKDVRTEEPTAYSAEINKEQFAVDYPNYCISQDTVSPIFLTITPLPISIVWKDVRSNYPYNGNGRGPDLESYAIPGTPGETVNIQVDYYDQDGQLIPEQKKPVDKGTGYKAAASIFDVTCDDGVEPSYPTNYIFDEQTETEQVYGIDAVTKAIEWIPGSGIEASEIDQTGRSTSKVYDADPHYVKASTPIPLDDEGIDVVIITEYYKGTEIDPASQIEADSITEAGVYTMRAVISPESMQEIGGEEAQNFSIANDTYTIEITRRPVTPIWAWAEVPAEAGKAADGAMAFTHTYDSKNHVPALSFVGAKDQTVTGVLETLGVEVPATVVDASDTPYSISIEDVTDEVFEAQYPNYILADDSILTSTLKIDRYLIDTVVWSWAGVSNQLEDGSFTWIFDGYQHAPAATFHNPFTNEDWQIGSVTVAPGTVRNVGTYTASIANGAYMGEFINFVLDQDKSNVLTITQADVPTLSFNAPTVYNGAYQLITATFVPAAGEGSVQSQSKLVVTLNGEDITAKGVREAGDYTVQVSFDGADSVNYRFAEEAKLEYTFTVKPRSITVHGDVLSKTAGTLDPAIFTYDKEPVTDNEKLVPWAGGDVTIRSELPDDLLKRVAGEAVGKYPYLVGSKDPRLANYEITVDNATAFEIERMKLTVAEATKKITSREGRIEFTTDMLEAKKAKKDESVARKLVISARFPSDTKGISFPTSIDDYIANATNGRVFTEVGDSISIKDVTYSTGKNKKSLSWNGKLPAGTELTLGVYVYDAEVDPVWTLASNTATVEVTTQAVAMEWGSTADGVPSTNYLSKDDRLTLKALAQAMNASANYDSKNEYVEVRYDGTQYYQTLDILDIKPVVSNSGSTHNKQTATATFVDALNLTFTPVSYEFTYDDSAFEIPAGNIQFHNRDKKISISLPEIGTVKSVTIPGADVKLSGGEGEKFEFDVSWSGQKLIPTGSSVQVVYTDQGGNEGKGGTSAARSTVNTPIRLQIRPELNGRGYLTGRGTLIVSGSACTCEPLSISVAGMTKSTNVAARDVWVDENGSFEVSFDMNRTALPERQAFTVSAEYTDVNGTGATLTASYDEFANAAGVISPVFRAMPFVSGMAEADSTVILRIGDKSYEMRRDSFGHFAMDNVDMMMPGDTFTVSVIDIAGNENNKATFTIPAADEPVRGTLGAIGQFFYDPGEERSYVYTATPVRVSDMNEEGTELPLLLGGSYKVGTITLTKSAGGLTVQSQLDPEVFKDEEFYTVTGDTFYVFTEKPTVDQLRNHAGTVYHFGDTVPVGNSDVLWIVDGRTLEMSVSDINALETYNFFPLSQEDKLAYPERDQEYAAYVAFQEFRADAGTSAEPEDVQESTDTQEQQA